MTGKINSLCFWCQVLYNLLPGNINIALWGCVSTNLLTLLRSNRHQEGLAIHFCVTIYSEVFKRHFAHSLWSLNGTTKVNIEWFQPVCRHDTCIWSISPFGSIIKFSCFFMFSCFDDLYGLNFLKSFFSRFAILNCRKWYSSFGHLKVNYEHSKLNVAICCRLDPHMDLECLRYHGGNAMM